MNSNRLNDELFISKEDAQHLLGKNMFNTLFEDCLVEEKEKKWSDLVLYTALLLYRFGIHRETIRNKNRLRLLFSSESFWEDVSFYSRSLP